ncbi:2-dehydro-3-deoxygalactonokinase [Stenotrophomonas chelatiphaga]|uniref:2-dehydro-3-deoxygalactonokinase n=1 Tax=Stenotrophomonas chelatiphaga TaxID=517011 RepID=UPI002897E68E|nr:2-dehydro-3-deoxygalactonokinase [Stenotrophomonas chelatiphaga]
MIAIDWGSSSLRAFRLDRDGHRVDSRRSDQGLLNADGRFAEVLETLIDGWDDALVVMAGMIGSRQGWMEVPYVQAPAGVQEIAAGMRRLQSAAVQRELWLVPGLSCMDVHGTPDVMRGEETQLCALLPVLGPGRHVVLLPGTHSKHARVVDGRIERFSTFMTGELFAVLRQHSLLGRMMVDAPLDAAAFAEGVAMAARDGSLLHQLFGVRTRALFDQLLPAQLASYLSGLLIGTELQDLDAHSAPVHVIAAEGLADAYLSALALVGRTATRHAEDTVARGLYLLARARELPI